MNHFVFMVSLFLIVAVPAVAEEPPLCHRELSDWIQGGHPLVLVDIQSDDGFRKHHYEGAIAAGPDPVRWAGIAGEILRREGTIVVVSATGGTKAREAVGELARHGIDPTRLRVLEGGMEAAAKAVACDCCSADGGRNEP